MRRMVVEYDLGKGGGLRRKLRDDRKHSGMESGLWLINCDQCSRLWIGEDGDEKKKPQSSIRKICGRLFGLQCTPPEPKLDPLIPRRRKSELLVTCPEGRSHDQVKLFLEASIPCV